MAGGSTKTGYAYEQVRHRIMTGALEPDTILHINQLAEELGISVTPMREAFRQLAAEGLVVSDAHRNPRVAPLSADEATYLFELREKLDPMAARLAAQRATDEERHHIRELAEQLHPLTGPQDLEGMDTHRQFHRAIYTASHNPLLSRTLEGLWDKADRYRQIGIANRNDDATDQHRVEIEHTEITNAITTRDPDTAESWMLTHVRRSLGRRAISVLSEHSDA